MADLVSFSASLGAVLRMKNLVSELSHTVHSDTTTLFYRQRMVGGFNRDCGNYTNLA